MRALIVELALRWIAPAWPDSASHSALGSALVIRIGAMPETVRARLHPLISRFL